MIFKFINQLIFKNKNKLPQLKIAGKKSIDINFEKNILDNVKDNNIDIDNSCGGMGVCGTCRVLITKKANELPPRNRIETAMYKDRGLDPNERLACQIQPLEDLEIKIL